MAALREAGGFIARMRSVIHAEFALDTPSADAILRPGSSQLLFISDWFALLNFEFGFPAAAALGASMCWVWETFPIGGDLDFSRSGDCTRAGSE
jgi:hypothetical protein